MKNNDDYSELTRADNIFVFSIMGGFSAIWIGAAVWMMCGGPA
jgi:hypothetical protein